MASFRERVSSRYWSPSWVSSPPPDPTRNTLRRPRRTIAAAYAATSACWARTASRPARCCAGNGLRSLTGGRTSVVTEEISSPELAGDQGQVASGPVGKDPVSHEHPLVEVGDAAQERGVDREPLEWDQQHERRQHGVDTGVARRVHHEHAGAGLLGRGDCPLRHLARLVGAQQGHDVEPGPLERLDRPMAELGRLDDRAADADVLHEHRERELVAQAIQRTGGEHRERGAAQEAPVHSRPVGSSSR